MTNLVRYTICTFGICRHFEFQNEIERNFVSEKFLDSLFACRWNAGTPWMGKLLNSAPGCKDQTPLKLPTTQVF